jgi:hemolysin III
LVWGLTLAALIAKRVFTKRLAKPPAWLYLVMSWFALLVFNQIMRDIGGLSLRFLLIGGVFYTTGIIFYLWRKLPFSHAVWHLFVMGGSIFHFFSVLQLV